MNAAAGDALFFACDDVGREEAFFDGPGGVLRTAADVANVA